ncbi:unnamed protein product [Rotaria sp. Silwood2]|nr:unnamed protein product [Rotaria sp. Silwood2]CAF2468317.1 unnamed protein product [Rotaria sp. Silwood2]CAF2704096.1 unnamed protein product [Rotaria sp. Silwood2]CAF2856696.1 unnamed protein product [Rotaria sp. Silwood2]CAF3858328.1 unnamed protein product [Rotaria sp. Silwood2]
MKSLIKPPPPRTSWELLLDDYLKDPNFKSSLTPKLSPTNSPSYQQSTLPLPHSISPIPFQQTFIPSSYYQYPLNSSNIPYQTKSYLPPRRYKMTLDELVYLISQVGRSDLYREMVQYIKAQQLSTSSNISSSHLNNKSSNINANSKKTTTDLLLLNNIKKKQCNISPQVQDELIKKLNRLKINKKIK